MAMEEKIDAVAAFSEVVATNDYKVQAQFFLNAEWPDINTDGGDQSDCEKIYQYVKLFFQADEEFPQDANGRSLVQGWAQQVLQKTELTMTAMEFRQEFGQIDIDNDKRMSVLEFLVYWLRKKREVEPPSNPGLATSTTAIVEELMSRPQGTNENLERAEAALAEVNAEADRIQSEIKRLEGLANSDRVVVRGRAKAELEQLLSSDKTELNRRIVTAEAQVRLAANDTSLQAAGKIWWMQREIEEANKYLPNKRRK